MSGILSIAYTGLNAFQNALNTTSNNIVNSTVRGYSRQTLQLTPAFTNRYGTSYIGSGVLVNGVRRNVDQFANDQVRNTTSIKSQFDSFYQQSLQIDKLLSQDGSSISTAMQSFFDAIGQMNNAPDSIPYRGVMLKQSQLLGEQFNTLQNRLDEYQNNTTIQLGESINRMNELTAGIASLNKQLLGNKVDPLLLDSRDELVRELSEYSQLSIAKQSDGTLSVGLASGELLVAGSDQRLLSIGSNLTVNDTTSVLLGTGTGQMDITTRLTSGKLGGLINYENEVLGHASQLIGQMAIGLAQTFNAQHQLGMDMNNQLGKNFFTDYNTLAMQQGRASNSPSNLGTGVLSVDISDISQTQISDYSLIVTDASSNELRVLRNSDGQSTTLNWSSNPPAPPAGQVVIDGMTITVDNIANLATNDKFNIVPTRGAARDFNLEISNVNQIALASPVRTMASVNNIGKGQIALGSLLNTAVVNKEFSINFTSPTEYTLVNVTDGTTSGPFAFTPNSDNTLQIPDSANPSYSVVLSGAPEAGDTFSTTYNTGGIGDNRNGLSLSGLQQSKFLSGGTSSLFDTYANLLADVGGQTNAAKISAQTADVLFKSAVKQRESTSGVNLDEEGANLLRFQQAYEAAGKLMEVSSQIMNVIFQMVRI